ncbi:(3S)-malyl-CoA thioesterase [Albidovulum inexpectatum]|uniref:(3S)-malyl-CoA thioesterase n=1 Tax=Albidovulum inexpectatum TaxID=196587 RepID=A0A2S5JL40_9RHOB|nr:CoA ester lyase [Albidovulum inexpectatum]PPB82152.1 (3S)-malyl-CoA thioesterase [Albidovulum inexpectatum]
MTAADDRLRPYRSVLYIPGSRERALDKARELPADAIIFDLEDAVAADEKENARGLLRKKLAATDYGPRARIVRINGLDTPWGQDDLAAFADADIEAILVPKVGSAADIESVAGRVPDTPIWAMMETPQAMLNAAEIAAHPRLAGMVMGTNDLAKELGCRFRADRLPLMTSLQLCLLAARAHGLVIVDGVYNAFRDEDGLRAECRQSRDLGFDGKTVIHPAQIEIANEEFAPSEDEIEMARRQIQAFEEAEREGKGVAVVDGKIVENLHVVTARQILARAQAIAMRAK